MQFRAFSRVFGPPSRSAFRYYSNDSIAFLSYEFSPPVDIETTLNLFFSRISQISFEIWMIISLALPFFSGWKYIGKHLKAGFVG